MRRAQGALIGHWHPVMGHVLEGETAPQTALRELAEETGYVPSDLWQLELPNTYYLASHETIVISPCFAALVDFETELILNDEHDAARWVGQDEVETSFLWPGQRQAIAQIVRDLLPADSPHLSLLRIDLE
jgi:8-oxo-dGTP pyrophosphatase MutT (NUDIX family)